MSAHQKREYEPKLYVVCKLAGVWCVGTLYISIGSHSYYYFSVV